MRKNFRAWLDGEIDPMDNITDVYESEDITREESRRIYHETERELAARPEVMRSVEAARKRFYKLYLLTAIISCIVLSGVLIYVVSGLPRHGTVNPSTLEVTDRYIEKGLEETGAINIVSGMILDYRAFDTLGESHVLFTALVCVLILLRIDRKNQRTGFEDYYTIRSDVYYDLSADPILRLICAFLVPSIFMYGIYIVLNGQNSPGGGFSGGAVMGAGMILFSAAYGMETADRFFTLKLCNTITFVSLAFYSFAKGYVFFTGANEIANHIPKGTPGAILSGGMILPLDIAVGCVVACTMFGFYSLFRRGSIGVDVDYSQYERKKKRRKGGSGS